MKTIHVILVVVSLCGAAVASLAQSGPVAPRHYLIAIAPGLSKEEGTETFRSSVDFLLTRAQPGDRVEFIDAPALARLADVTIPRGSARDRAFSREFNGKFGLLKKFLTEPGACDPRLAGQLRLPQLADLVAKGRQTNECTTLILIGSPLFITTHPTETAFNMEGGLTPGDGMVTCSSSMSLFGTEDRQGQLNGVVIHWVTQGDAWATGEMHRSAVARFWSVFLGEQGATLATLSSDTGSVFDRAARGEARPVMAAKIDPNDSGLVMRPPQAFRREAKSAAPEQRATAPARPFVEVPQPIQSTIHLPVLALPATNPHVAVPSVAAEAPVLVKEQEPAVRGQRVDNGELAAAVAKEIPRAAQGHIGIAAIWQVSNRSSGDADIDLHVSSSPNAPEVYWHRPQAPGATYYRDIRQASVSSRAENWQASWEFVEVSHADLSKVSLWLNVYETSGPISGIVRVQYDGRTEDRPFRFDVTRGNKGVDNRVEARKRSPYWQEIRLEEMFPETSGSHMTTTDSK